jgi:hypothetical protein
VTVNASPVTPTGRYLYALNVSPRTTRDPAAIKVDIDPHGAQPDGEKVLGSGTPEQGGGPLRGGLTLMNRFTAVIEDPDVSYAITVTVGAHDGWLAIESVTIAQRPGGQVITGMALRSIVPSIYLERIREELERYLGGGLIMKPAGRTDRTVSYEFPLTADDLESFDLGQLRRAARAARVTTEAAADAYREALASPDPHLNKRPTAAAAEKLGVSRGYISTLLTQGRREGLPGLGAPRARRGGGAARSRESATGGDPR